MSLTPICPSDITIQGTDPSGPPPQSPTPRLNVNSGTSHNPTDEPEPVIGGDRQNDDVYYAITDQSVEYSYAYANKQDMDRLKRINAKSDEGTYADVGESPPPAEENDFAKPSNQEGAEETEGWMENSIYATSDDGGGGVQKDMGLSRDEGDDEGRKDEGWVDNNIYGD